MHEWMWMTAGAAAMALLGVIVLCVMESEFRTALGQVLVALALGPTMAVVALTRSGPRAMPLSAAALETFARQQSGSFGPGITKADRAAWLLAYKGRGVILLRRKPREFDGWINNAPNSAQRARSDAKRQSRARRTES